MKASITNGTRIRLHPMGRPEGVYLKPGQEPIPWESLPEIIRTLVFLHNDVVEDILTKYRRGDISDDDFPEWATLMTLGDG